MKLHSHIIDAIFYLWDTNKIKMHEMFIGVIFLGFAAKPSKLSYYQVTSEYKSYNFINFI